jgi:anti-sigma factor RsiW
VTTCERVRERLPEHVLGTLEEADDLAVRRHLRGCAGCRAEMDALDDGLASFARAAHDAEPPAELQERVRSTLAAEWRDAPPADVASGADARRSRTPWVAAAAAVLALVLALGWGLAQVHRADELAASGDSYTRLLQILGGKEFRAGPLTPAPGRAVQGSVVVYESHRDQSWVAVFVEGAGMSGPATATLHAPDGRTVELWDLEFQKDGSGAAWLVTASDLSTFDHLTITDENGEPLATAQIEPV